MKNYIFLFSILAVVMSSCADDDSIIKTEEERVSVIKDLFEHNFTPTIENYFGRDHVGTVTNRSSSLSGDWIHEYDDEGRLYKSQLYEKYPQRILKEIIFSLYNKDANKVKLQVITYNYFTFTTYDHGNFELRFNEDFLLKGISQEFENGPTEIVDFEELNSNNWISLLKYQHIPGYVGYDYDAMGNILMYTVYDKDLNISSTVKYTYTDFGDLESYYFKNTHNNFSTVNYFYRSDNTLDRFEGVFNFGQENIGISTFIYEADESYSKEITEYENGKREITNYKGEEIIKEYYEINEKLAEVYGYFFSESLGKYYLKEYQKYDENGALYYTEYYDEEGNVIETIYE